MEQFLNTLGPLIERFGLPLVALVAMSVVWYRGDFISRRSYQRLVGGREAEFQVQLAYVESRRVEEREARLAAEKRLEVILPAIAESTHLLREVREELLRGTRR